MNSSSSSEVLSDRAFPTFYTCLPQVLHMAIRMICHSLAGLAKQLDTRRLCLYTYDITLYDRNLPIAWTYFATGLKFSV